MIVEHEDENLNNLMQQMLKYCIKNEIMINFINHKSYFGYRIQTELKEYRGIITKHNNKQFEKYYENIDTNSENWIINNRITKNPYLCCNNSFINITKNYIEVFCIHFDYLEDEILSLII